MVECPHCGNIAKFTVIVTIHKVYTRTYDEDGDLVEETQEKEGLSRQETWICSECAGVIPNKASEPINNPPVSKPVNNRQATSASIKKPSKDKKKIPNGKRKINKVGECPTDKQLKYLNDLADLLEIPEEEREDFKNFSKQEVSIKLTKLYKKCKRKGLEI